jgi:hypothetical protein
MSRTEKSNQSQRATYKHQHRFEHWYRDNQVYFITAKTALGRPVFSTPTACDIFWKAFDNAYAVGSFTPWVTSLMNNHYHTLGYLKTGNRLHKMMQSLHGNISKQINDLRQAEAGGLKPARLLPFWGHRGKKTYFDGCIRDEQQATRAYHYTSDQAVRANLVKHWSDYPHTRIDIPLDKALPHATQLNAFLRGVPHKRYQTKTTPQAPQGGGT